VYRFFEITCARDDLTAMSYHICTTALDIVCVWNDVFNATATLSGCAYDMLWQ